MVRKSKKSYSITLNRGQIIFLSVILLLLCGLSFSLGIVMGYGMLTSTLHQQLPKQEELASSQEKSEEATFYETLQDNPQESPVTPQSKDHITSSNNYQIQVGAFRQEKEAQALQKRLQKKGYYTIVTKAVLKGKGIWFRVRAGNCATKAEARELADKLSKKEHLPTLIVR